MLISGLLKDLESNFSTKYPFETLSMVEVPVQFYHIRKKVLKPGQKYSHQWFFFRKDFLPYSRPDSISCSPNRSLG